MKKILLILAALAAVVLAGGIGYLFLMEDEAPDAVLVDGDREQPDDEGEEILTLEADNSTGADILEALDYETIQNPDTVAWLLIPGTRINNSVVQSFDNLVYLRANERREESIYGCYFADAECSVSSRELLNHNTIVYGHSDLQDNPEGPRFSELYKFTDPQFASRTPVIEFSTLYDFMNWEVFAVFYTTVDFDYISAEPEGGVKALAAEAKKQSIYDYGIQVGEDDHILTLSTCSVKDGNDGTHRFVVMARLLDEDAQVPAAVEVKAHTPGEELPETRTQEEETSETETEAETAEA